MLQHVFVFGVDMVCLSVCLLFFSKIYKAEAVAQSVRAIALHAKVGCSNPSRAKDLSCDSSTDKRSAIDGCSEMYIINGCPVSKKVCYAEEHILLKGHECRAGNGVLVIWVKILEWTKTPNKQTNAIKRSRQKWGNRRLFTHRKGDNPYLCPFSFFCRHT